MNDYRPVLVFVACILLTVPFTSNGQAFKTETGFVSFTSSVPLHSFTGSSDHLVGKIDLQQSTVDFYVDLTTLDTGNSKRDKDMMETLEIEEFPFAEFFGKLTSDFNPNSDTPQSARVEGEFTVHGVTNTVDISGTLQMTEDGLRVNASWTLLLNDYDIEPPGILFYKVDEEQEIKIDALLKPISN